MLSDSASIMGIAVCHTAFKLACVALLFPCSSLLEKLALKVIPESKKPEEVAELDPRLLATPSIALQRCHSLTAEMATVSHGALKKALSLLSTFSPEEAKEVRAMEEKSDHFEDILSTYLVKLSNKRLTEKESGEVTKLLKMIGDFERLSDHSVNIVESAEELKEKALAFSPEAKKELSVITAAIAEILDLTLDAFLNDDLKIASRVEPLEQIIDDLKEALRTQHIRRLQVGNCSIEAGFVWSDLLTNIERCSDHCSNIAGCLLEMNRDEFSLHEALRHFRVDSPEYQENLRHYSEKYSIQEMKESV
jgi:phosphate:Na+ symporter